jgi:hypothetical protein
MATAAEATDAAMEAPRERNVIYEGDTVICQTSDGRMFFQAAKKDEYGPRVHCEAVARSQTLTDALGLTGPSAWARS